MNQDCSPLHPISIHAPHSVDWASEEAGGRLASWWLRREHGLQLADWRHGVLHAHVEVVDDHQARHREFLEIIAPNPSGHLLRRLPRDEPQWRLAVSNDLQLVPSQVDDQP